MRQWHFLQLSLHPRHLESISAIIAEMGTRGIHEQPLNSGEVLLKAYFDPSSDIGRVHSDFRARCQAAAVPLSGCATGIETERDWLKEWRRKSEAFFRRRPFLHHSRAACFRKCRPGPHSHVAGAPDGLWNRHARIDPALPGGA